MKEPTISIHDLQSMRVIYIRFRGTYVGFRRNSRKLFNQIFDFARKNNLVIPDVTKVLTIYHDNPFITDQKNLRTSVAMTVPDDIYIEETDDICVMTISGKFGVGSFDIKPSEYGDAWNYMYHEWLFKSRYTSRDSFPFELYVTEPPKSSTETSITEIYIPID